MVKYVYAFLKLSCQSMLGRKVQFCLESDDFFPRHTNIFEALFFIDDMIPWYNLSSKSNWNILC